MKLVRNTGTSRVIDFVRPGLARGCRLHAATQAFSLFAFAELMRELGTLAQCRLMLPPSATDLALLGSPADRVFRNRLNSRWLAQRLAEWIQDTAEVRRAIGPIPQGALILLDSNEEAAQALIGSLALSTDGLGLAPGNPMSLIQASETAEEAALLSQWFDAQWSCLPADSAAKATLVEAVQAIAVHREPSLVYAAILHHLFYDREGGLDEDRIVKSATGIRNTVVWQKLFKFQRDGVVGAIDKLNRFGGCIIADSVGLGKTFEALAIIKYHELRNDRVLVLCPKRLRDNWTMYKANDRRNFLAPDRFNYDVLNHTDLSRDGGVSGDINLAHVNWGNYDLVVIDESHNFRNKQTPRQGGETRYDRLLRRIIKEGVKTRVLKWQPRPKHVLSPAEGSPPTAPTPKSPPDPRAPQAGSAPPAMPSGTASAPRSSSITPKAPTTSVPAPSPPCSATSSLSSSPTALSKNSASRPLPSPSGACAASSPKSSTFSRPSTPKPSSSTAIKSSPPFPVSRRLV